MTLGEFHTLVSTCMKRGTALDASIPTQVALAVQWMERNYTMKYMERFRLLQVTANDRVISMPPNVMFKGAKFVRLINDDGTYGYLNKIEPEDLTGLRSSTSNPTSQDVVPSAYYVVGLDTLVLDSVPDVDWNGEAMFYEFTDWPTDTASTHPLLRMAADVLLAQTQWFMAINIIKDLRMAEVYKAARDEAMSTLTRTEDEIKYGGESVSMAFVPTSS